MRTGAQYLDSLNDGRVVVLDGEVVDNLLEHPAFASVAKTVAELYDLAADPANGMQFHSPDIDETANRVFAAPRSREDMRARREAVEVWAKHTHGWFGRSPDHVGTFFAGFGTHAEVFESEERDYAGNMRRFYERILRENLYVSYAIIPPAISRGSTASEWGDDLLQVGVVRETDEGIIVRGAQMLATGGPLSDEVFVTCIKPLGPDDKQFAISFVIPASTEGFKMYCRRPYAPAATSDFDYPLTSRYDEPDALLVFDDVLVPWDRVFINQDLDKLRAQFFATGAHALGNWQAQTRFMTKLRFIAGVAQKIVTNNGTERSPGVRELLGELASIVSSVEAAVLASEYTSEPDANGIFIPGKRTLYGAMGLQSETYQKCIQILRLLVSGGVMQLPASYKDMQSDLTRSDIERYYCSLELDAHDRTQLFRLAWDIVGSEFAGRHQQYEMFYAGSPAVVRGTYAYLNFDYSTEVAKVDEFLAAYDLDTSHADA